VYLLAWKKGQYSLSDLHKLPLNGSQTKAEALRPFWLPLVQWCMHYALRISSADLCYHRFIPPLLPYAVLTLSHSISQGVHTFLWQMMRQSVGGIYSLSSTHILLRMLNKLYHRFFYLDAETRSKSEIHSIEQAHHLPDMSSFKKVITLLFLLNVVTLGHILYCLYYFEQEACTKFGLIDKSRQWESWNT